MNLTEHYKLKKPQANEYYNVEDFNDNADIVDEALHKFAAEHQVIHYSSLQSIELSDSDFINEEDGVLLTDVDAFFEIFCHLQENTELHLTGMSSSENLAKIIISKLKTDVNYWRDSTVINAVFSRKQYYLTIRVLAAYYSATSSDSAKKMSATEYSCIFRTQTSGSVKYLPPFTETVYPAGFVAADGSREMSGDLKIKKETPRMILQSPTGQQARFSNLDDQNCTVMQASATEDAKTYRQLRLFHDGGAENVKDALVLRDETDDGTKTYKLYGDHNKPSCDEINAAQKSHGHTAKEIGAAPAESILDNADWTNPVDQKKGYIALGGTTVYSDPELTTVASVLQSGIAVRYVNETYCTFKSTSTGELRYIPTENVIRGYAHSAHYTLDRWYSTSGIRFSIEDGSVKVENFTSNSFAFSQFIPKEKTPAVGEKITLALENVEGEVFVGSTTMPESERVYFKLNNGKISFAIDPPAYTTSGFAALRAFVIAGKSENIKWIALYEGEYTADTLPPYQPKGYAAEYAICRQYNPETGEYIGLTCDTFGALSKTGGAMDGALVAHNDSDYSAYKVRNAAILNAVPSSMQNGTVAFVYK